MYIYKLPNNTSTAVHQTFFKVPRYGKSNQREAHLGNLSLNKYPSVIEKTCCARARENTVEHLYPAHVLHSL